MSSTLMLIAPLLFGSDVLPAGEFEVEPREITWEQLSRQFDRRWCFPEERSSQGRDLVAEMERLSDLRFEATVDGRELRTLGDLVDATRGLRGKQLDDWLARLDRSNPKFWSDWGEGLSELLLDDQLRGNDWDPGDCHPRDGILFAEEWRLKTEPGPWRDVDVSTRAHQAATVLRSDLATLKAAENDYRAYPTQVGASYEAIYPIQDSYVRGTDPNGNGFSALKLYFRTDLPWPYSDFECQLNILTRFDGMGRLVTDIYSVSEDFYWLAGRDVFVPLDMSNGEIAGYLQVRQYGFDIDGVPDGESNRKEALRASLGNLKRGAERLFARAPVESDGEDLPLFRVRGVR